MASFLQQLRLLLWKNGLSVIRQPAWSVALIVWPLVIFIILAITRSQFPPEPKDTCYVAPRNLPSAGFFPFLQTLMCNTDSTCSNRSHLVKSRSGGSLRMSWTSEDTHRLASLPFGPGTMAAVQNRGLVHASLMADTADQPQLMDIWDRMLNSSHQGMPNKTTIIDSLNSTLLQDQEVLNAIMESVNLLKRSLCNVSLSILKISGHSSIDPFTYGLVSFCKTNDTLLEVVLLTLNQVMTELLLNNPVALLESLGEAVVVYDRLQLQTPLWETMLALPRLFLPTSLEEKLSDGYVILYNIKRTLNAIQSSFPEVNISVSTVNPAFDDAIGLLQYINNWPGKGVYIPLSSVITVPPNASLSIAETALIQQVKVSLDKAAALMDYTSFYALVCASPSQPSLTQICTGGRLPVLYGLISQDKVTQQVLQAWARDVAPSDTAVVSQLLNSLLGGSSPGNQGFSNMLQHNSSGQPLSPGEQLFLDVGSVALDLMKGLPGWSYIHIFLMGAHASMDLTTETLNFQQEQMSNVLADASYIQQTFLSLLQDQAAADAWAERVTASAVETTVKVLLSPGPVNCSDLAAPWLWLSNLSSIPPHLQELIFCPGNDSSAVNVLLAYLEPVVQKVNVLVAVIQGQDTFNVTLPMLLSDWNTLSQTYVRFSQFLGGFFSTLDQSYWAAWFPHPDNITVDWAGILTRRGLDVFGTAGSELQKSPLWPGAEPYFHIAYWIMTYQPNVTMPPKCAVDVVTMVPHCLTDFTWEKFVAQTSSLIAEFSTNPAALVRCVQGSAAFLQAVYGDYAVDTAVQLISSPELLPGDGSIQSLLGSLIHLLDQDIQLLSNILSLEQFNSQLSLSVLEDVLGALGLRPLTAIWAEGPVNASTVIGAILQAAQNNQYLLSGIGLPQNQTDLSVAELEALIFQWLSMEGRLSLPLSLSMGDALLTYSASLSAADLAYLQQVLDPLANQSANGVAELILQAMKVLKQVLETPGDPSVVILGYLRQLQDFLSSALQLSSHIQVIGPNGPLTPPQISNLRPVALETLQLLQGLIQTNDLSLLDAILKRLGGLLPQELLPRYEELINHTHVLIGHLSACAESGLDCTAAVSQTFQILAQSAEALQQATGGVFTIELIPVNTSPLSGQGDLPLSVTVDLLSLLLPWANASNTTSSPESIQKIIAQTLHFLQQVSSTPNISLNSVQYALQTSNLTLGELDMIARLAGSTNMTALLANLIGIIDVQQCFEPRPQNLSLQGGFSNSAEANCALELIMRTTGFLQGLPLPQDTQNTYTALNYLIRFWADEFIGKGDLVTLLSSLGEGQVNTSVNALMVMLENVSENLEDLLPDSWQQINNEIQVLEGLLHLVSAVYPFDTINTTLMNQQEYAQRVVIEIAEWYLQKLENVTRSSNFSDLFYPIFRITEMQLAYALAQTQYTEFVTEETEDLLKSVHIPLNGTDLSKIGHYVIAVLQGNLQLVKKNVELQRDFYVALGQQAPDFGFLEEIETQIMKYFNLTRYWLNDAHLTSAIAKILQWDAASLNLTTPVTDIGRLLDALAPVLPEDQEAYLILVNNVSQALNHALLAASQEGGVQSANFTKAILEAARTILQNLSAATGPLPASVIQDALGVLQGSLQLIVHPEMSYAEARQLTLNILRQGEALIQALFPREATPVLLQMTRAVTVYLETISQPGGQDKWNEIIMNELQLFLPPNTSAEAYLSLIMGVTELFLGPSQEGNLSLWESLLNGDVRDLAEATDKLRGILDSLSRLLPGGQELGLALQSTQALSDAVPVLLQVVSAQADEHTWDRAERMFGSLLLAINGTPFWDAIPIVLPVMRAWVRSFRASAELLHSLQKPIATLMSDIALAVNSSDVSVNAVLESIPEVIEDTVAVIQQAQGTGQAFECKDVVEVLEELSETVGISEDSLVMWCNISLLPAIDEYMSGASVLANLSTIGVGMEMNPDIITPATIVTELRDLYSAILNLTRNFEGLVIELVDDISKLPNLPQQGQNSTDALMNQILGQHMYQSILEVPTYIKPFLEQVTAAAPWMQPYVHAVEMTVNYTLWNSFGPGNASVTPQLLGEALQIFLTGLNWKDDSIQHILNGDLFSSTDGRFIDKVLKDTIRELIRLRVLGDWPMAYGVMEQLLGVDATGVLLEQAFELNAWWGSTEASGMNFLSEAMVRLYGMVRAVLSSVTELNFPLPSYSNIFVDLAGNVLNMLRQIARTSDLFAPIDAYLAQLQGQVAGGMTLNDLPPQTRASNRVRRAAEREPIDDFLDLFEVDYQTLLKALSAPPTTAEIMETVHVFFANPDLAVVLKGLSREMMGGPNQDETVDTAVRVLSYITASGQWEKYVEVFTQIAQEGWSLSDLSKMEKLVESMGTLVDVAVVLSRQPSLDVAQKLEHMVQQLSPVVSNIIQGKQGNNDTAIQLLMAFTSILQENVEAAKDVSTLVSTIVQDLVTSISRPESQNSIDPYIMALDQTVAAFATFLPSVDVMYLNSSAQLIKGFLMLVYYPRNMEKLLLSTSIISASLDHLLTAAGETSLPSGQSVQEVSHSIVLNSVLATQALWNLSTSNQSFASMQERQQAATQVLQHLVSMLPEEQRKYVLPLQPVLLSALSGVSSTAEIPLVFFNVSKQVTISLMTMLNVTESTLSPGNSTGGLVQILFGVSDLVSSSLWASLAMNPSTISLPHVFQPLRQAVMLLIPVLPSEGRHYLNASLQVLETMVVALNYTAASGDAMAIASTVGASVQSLLAIVPYPGFQASGNIITDLEQTFQDVLFILSSDSGPLDQTASIAQLLLHNLHSLLALANNSTEVQVTQMVLGAAQANIGHLLTMNTTNWVEKLPFVLSDIGGRIPDGLPYATLIKKLTRSLASESQEDLNILLQTGQTVSEIIASDWMSRNISLSLDCLLTQVCALEGMSSVQLLSQALSIPPGLLCELGVPTVQAVHMLTTSLLEDGNAGLKTLSDMLFETFIGDPTTYHVNANWTSALSESLGFNVSSLMSLNISVSPLGNIKVSDLLKNRTAFTMDVLHLTSIPPDVLNFLMDIVLPDNNLQLLAWLANMRHCSDPSILALNGTEELIFKVFCSLPPQEWYNFLVLVARYVNVENVIYRLILSNDMQSLVGVMLQMLKFLTDMMGKLLPSINRLQEYLVSIQDLNLVANPEFRSLVQGQRSTISSRATFTTVSRAMCTNGMLSLFGISKLPSFADSDPSTQGDPKIEELIEKFKIPRDATPFCMNFYLDMVNTTGGAIAWAFLKPMLLGRVLYTPDTPLTREIIQKSNATLQQFADLRLYAQDWLKSSSYVVDSANLLEKTLPILKNSLSNSFVQNFIQMQTDIDVAQMQQTLNNFSNMTTLLEKNKHIIQQITTLSTLMMNLSSCVNFNRFQGLNSTEELNTLGENLSRTRDLYASIIFNLPKSDPSSPSRRRRDASGSSLPPKVEYTIRMHIENVMRTDRARNPFWVKSAYISPLKTQRYNRGFIYLQESIERAIIETQTGHKVEEPAVQLQAFPYPCYLHDEYLNSISFAFPLVLMIAWVLFIANFVRKLVHERELRLHEYMKMMGVNPISHFFAWFIESAAFLVVTIIILTIILKGGNILPYSNGFLLFLYLCDYGLSIMAISFLVSSFFDKTNIAGLSGSLIYVICFFPYIVVVSLETSLSFSAKSALSLFAPTCFSYASQYISRYESQGQGIQWSNSYISPLAGDTASFGWLCWLLLIDSVLYFIVGAYIRMVFPGNYGIAAPWYFPVMPSFWADLFGCCKKGPEKKRRGLFFTNIMQKNLSVFPKDKDQAQCGFPSQVEDEFSGLPVGVALHGLTKTYGSRSAIQNLNVNFYEGHVTALLGHNGAGKTTTMSLLTGLFGPTSGSIEVYGRDMQTYIEDIRRELGVCMQYDVHFDHLTTKEHLLLYGQIKAPHWTRRELHEQVRKTLQETGMYAHRHKRVGTLSGGMKRKLSISIAFIGGSRLVVLDEPTTGVDPCSRRSIWDIVIQHKKDRTIILSTHHLDEAEVLSDRIAFLERGGLKCCGSPFYLKDKLAQGYNLTLTKKIQAPDSQERFDSEEVKAFIQSHLPEARLKEGENLDALQLGCYGISDTTLEEVFLQLTKDESQPEDVRSWPTGDSVVDLTASRESLPEESTGSSLGDRDILTGSASVRGLALIGQQIGAMLMKRVHRSRRDWKGLLSQVLLPVLFIIFAMGLGSIKTDLQHFPKMELSPALYHTGQQYSFFSNQNANSSQLVDTMLSFPGIDNACMDGGDNPVCLRNEKSDSGAWTSSGNSSAPLTPCKCTKTEQVCTHYNYQPPHKRIPSSQIVYNLTGLNIEDYLLVTADDFIRDRYGGFAFGKPLPTDLKMDLLDVPQNRTLTKVWYNPEGHHTMPAYLNTLNNVILRSSLPPEKDPQQYGISVSSHPYPGQVQDEDAMILSLVHILVALCVLAGYSIMTASFVIYEVQEHHSGSKRLQHISGIGEPFYWAINFFYDMALYMIPVALSIGMIAAFQLPAFTSHQNLGAVSLLLVLFGFATFPWMYLLSGVFKDAEMAFISYVCINLFVSVNTIISTAVVYFLWQLRGHEESVHQVYQTLSYVFLIFPQFSFGNGLMELARMEMQVQILSTYGVDAYKNPFGMDVLGWMFVSLFLQGAVCFILRLLMNKWLIRRIRRLLCRIRVLPEASPISENEDEDVVAERERVASGAASTDLLQVHQLTKVYQHLRKKVQAVKRLSVGIPAGECFGLLGVNGAGKTTTFKMLTGDISPTDGTAQIRDWDGRMVDIIDCRNEGINIGYCPQVDALDELLTGEEHLYFYARIRGISSREIDGVVNYLLRKLELVSHRHNISQNYSCGTRRKLSTALALIGHPQILLLDEPSSGMDPRSKRHLWRIISEEVKGKCAVVLTSHSMEECEALCTRLAIMVKGQFRCLGSLQHIKNRFGSGFTVKMYLAVASCDVNVITDFMQHRFPSTYLKDQHSAMVEYHVPVAPGGVADIFDRLEMHKAELQIKHFSVSQTTLDEVFINFAMGKVGMETIPIHSEGSDSESVDSIDAIDT
ncbi:hypothetical protein MATL_G00182090 [Megalops atlanticus]|uniref:ABC transporter domain-containing protein n=1 Tax=Megalops atlanticus TaxID=7932 RepID=A0A9D3PPL5_MEGAT|nr:hypothetical protein MATL_G00182090 [Megalops atlanticus]